MVRVADTSESEESEEGESRRDVEVEFVPLKKRYSARLEFFELLNIPFN